MTLCDSIISVDREHSNRSITHSDSGCSRRVATLWARTLSIHPVAVIVAILCQAPRGFPYWYKSIESGNFLVSESVIIKELEPNGHLVQA